MVENIDVFITLEQAAELIKTKTGLEISTETLRKHVAIGRFPYHARIGKPRVWLKSSVLKWIDNLIEGRNQE
jgi:predicted DNA-binding transcriptional regulator AlpA